MNKTRSTKSLSFFLCIVLIAAMALFATGCNGNTQNNAETPISSAASQAQATSLGEGETRFGFSVTDADGNETRFEISTDKATVGEALIDLGLIEGEEGPYGLYVKTVNGITLDYETDGKYWAFYINGEYAMTGVDVTAVTEGAEYSFKAE